jgi:hypothetical protein
MSTDRFEYWMLKNIRLVTRSDDGYVSNALRVMIRTRFLAFLLLVLTTALASADGNIGPSARSLVRLRHEFGSPIGCETGTTSSCSLGWRTKQQASRRHWKPTASSS